ncbi:AsmA family protein [Flavobacterium covae]|uniref:AsmA-like C-terminal region-containing protein n=1 Tax=Flavobacterium covae TaxID=2906076 RepID=UPI001FB7137F|nr:AsmA-like C-terminal region-containing protein [Flavobacterium covae]MCJ1806765.1 AsmA family protein [Flavobacterium covae]
MKKKIFIGIGASLFIIIGVLASIPLFFKDTIKAKIQETINENLNAKVAFADADISLFKSFPKATISLEKFTIINHAPFEGDTLVAFDELNLKMSVTELWKDKKEPMSLEAISIKNGLANILFNKEGKGNFDIAKKTNEPTSSNEKSEPFSMNIQNYAVENFRFKFYDERSKIKMVLDSIQHSGKGDFGSQKLDLQTQSVAKVSLDMDKMNYMKNVVITLDAVLGIDLSANKYTFKENKAKINELPLEFNGFIQMLQGEQLYDLTFKTPTSSFKNFLGLVPAQYAGNLETVKTSGDFTINGKVKGKLKENIIPTFNIAIASNNASFQYPQLPKSVRNIVIDTKIINDSGALSDTYVNLDQLSFQIDQDIFNAKASIKNVATNPNVNAALKGTINLGNFTKAYPIKIDKPLSGILKADITTEFNMQAVEKNEYEKIKNAGTLHLTGFNYTGPEMAKPVQIKLAQVSFNNSQIKLNQLDMKTGSSDLKINGVLENFYGFFFRKQTLKGNFNMGSTQLYVADFMAPAPVNSTNKPNSSTSNSEENTSSVKKGKKEAVKIPAFLDCTISAKANTVVYDNLALKNVSGKMMIKNETVSLQNVKTDIFNGTIGFNGLVSTKGNTPTFNMNLNLDKVDITQSFTQLNLLKNIAPIAGAITGKLNSTIKLNGNLDAVELTPDIKTLTGDLLGQLLSASINANNSQILSALGSQLKFLDIKKINLNDIKANLAFDKGRVIVKPFKIKYQDIVAEVGGTHGFDQNMNYNIKLDVPAKYLGGDVNKLLAKLSPNEASKIESVPINALMTGNFKSPKVTTDLKQASSNLALQIAKSQKDKYLNQGVDALSNILGGNKKGKDSTSTKDPKKEAIKNTANQVLEGLFGRRK